MNMMRSRLVFLPAGRATAQFVTAAVCLIFALGCIPRGAAQTAQPLAQGRQLVSNSVAVAETLDVSRDGRLVAGGFSDGSIAIWDFDSGRVVSRLPEQESDVCALRFSPDAMLLFSADLRGRVTVYDVNHLFSADLRGRVAACDVKQMKALRSIKGIRRPSRYQGASAAFSTDGRLVAVAENGKYDKNGTQILKIYDTESCREVSRISVENVAEITLLCFDAVAVRILVGSFAEPVRLYDVAAGRRHDLAARVSVFESVVALSPSGREFALSDGRSRIVRMRSSDGVVVGHIELSDRSPLRGIAYAESERQLAIADTSGRVRVWNLDSGSLDWDLGILENIPTHLAFVPGRGALVSTSGTSSLVVWTLPVVTSSKR